MGRTAVASCALFLLPAVVAFGFVTLALRVHRALDPVAVAWARSRRREGSRRAATMLVA
jgi:hypothetical protein